MIALFILPLVYIPFCGFMAAILPPVEHPAVEPEKVEIVQPIKADKG